MLAAYIIYLIAFIATSGIAVISILISYQVNQTQKKPQFQLLLYQQIFLFSFYIYSIWGNLALRQVLADVSVNPEIYARLALFLPLTGILFLAVSWYMLLRFSYSLNQISIPVIWIYIYFISFLILLSTAVYLFHTGILQTPSNPDNFLIRIYIPLNLLIHLLFLAPFLKTNPKQDLKYHKKKMNTCLLIYMGGTAVNSIVFWFSARLGFIYTAFSFLLLFLSGAMLPVCLKFFISFPEVQPAAPTNNFDSFCREYSISRRESEIILEICDGKTNKAIADKLFITLQTVKDHTHRIYTKTNVKSRVQLANLVREKTGKSKIHLS